MTNQQTDKTVQATREAMKNRQSNRPVNVTRTGLEMVERTPEPAASAASAGYPACLESDRPGSLP